MSSEAKRSLQHGDKFPFDAPDGWEVGDPVPPKDWAHRAARGVLADLCDRRGIKWGFQEIDEDVRVEVVESLAGIIRAADEERS